MSENIILKSGWVQKRGGGFIPSWKNRFFVLEGNTGLFYYADDRRKEKKGQVDLSDVDYISIVRDSDEKSILIKTKQKDLYFTCYAKSEAESWYKALTTFKDQIRMQRSIAKFQKRVEDEAIQKKQAHFTNELHPVHQYSPTSPPTTYMANNHSNGYNNNNNHNLIENNHHKYSISNKFELNTPIEEIEGKIDTPTGCIESSRPSKSSITSNVINTPYEKASAPPLEILDNHTTIKFKDDKEKEMYTTIPWPILPDGISLKTFAGRGKWVAVQKNTIHCDQSELGGFDNKPYDSQLLKVERDKPFHIYSFLTAAEKYLAVSENNLILSKNKYEFVVVWHSLNVISLKTVDGKFIRAFGETLNISTNLEGFEMVDQQFMIFPKASCPIGRIPKPVLPPHMRLKASNGLYLAYRSQPDHLEAVSAIMGKWETIFIEIVLRNTSVHLVYLRTVNGKYITPFADGRLNFTSQHEDKKSVWSIYIHKKDIISIQSYYYGQWLRIHPKQAWLLCDLKLGNFGFKDAQTMFEMSPWIVV